MTRSVSSRITQPIAIPRRLRRISPHVDSLRFTCFRLVPVGNTTVAIELARSSNLMFKLVT